MALNSEPSNDPRTKPYLGSGFAPPASAAGLDCPKYEGGGKQHDSGEITWLVTKYLQESFTVRLPDFRQHAAVGGRRRLCQDLS